MSEIKAAQDARRRIDAEYAAGKLAVEDYAVQRLEVDTQISALEKARSRPGNLGLIGIGGAVFGALGLLVAFMGGTNWWLLLIVGAVLVATDILMRRK